MKLISSLILIGLSFAAIAEDNVIATIIAAKGDIKAKLPTGEIVEVNTTSGLTEGTFIKTGSASFVKLVFVDRSYMTLGPESLVKISKFTKKDAGIISLVRGQIRSQVTKDYMELEDKNKSKLFVRTRSAAMGIRGTDFQVDYSKENDKTTLLTFEGKVVMNKIDEKSRERELGPKELDRLLEQKDRVEVTKGQLSDIRSDSKRIERPRTVEVAILDKLKTQDFPKEIVIEKKEVDAQRGDKNGQVEKRPDSTREVQRPVEDRKDANDFEDIINKQDSTEKKEVEKKEVEKKEVEKKEVEKKEVEKKEVEKLENKKENKKEDKKEELKRKMSDKKEKMREKRESVKERLEDRKEEIKEKIEEHRDDIKEEAKEGSVLAPKS